MNVRGIILDIPIERVREVLAYNPDTGTLNWLIRPNRKMQCGDSAGTPNSHGYTVISVDKVKYQSHRLIWAIHYGEQPPRLIDHIDGNRSNNCISNLRAASFSQNCHNARIPKNNKSGAKGVQHRDGVFIAQIQINRVRKQLGRFSTLAEAEGAYAAAAAQHFGEFNLLAAKGDSRG